MRDVYDSWNMSGELPKVKKCPFCGGNSILCDNGYSEPIIDPDTGAYAGMDIEEGDFFWFECRECGASQKGADTIEAAIGQWNRRYEPSSPPLAPEELREIVQQLSFCGYECEGGPLETNKAFMRLKELANMAEKLRSEENKPLTGEELREMDGVPVWVVGISSINNFQGHWDICDWDYLGGGEPYFSYCMETPDIQLCGITWFAYRRRPEVENGSDETD